MDIDRKIALKRSVFVGLLILVVLVFGVLFLSPARGLAFSEMENLKLIPMPEHFTELYFENASSLPRNIVAKQPVSFSFVIHNEEGAAMAYPYLVFFEPLSGGQMILASGTVSLADAEWVTASVSHIFPESNLQGTVVVELTSLDQQIDFIVPDTN